MILEFGGLLDKLVLLQILICLSSASQPPLDYLLKAKIKPLHTFHLPSPSPVLFQNNTAYTTTNNKVLSINLKSSNKSLQYTSTKFNYPQSLFTTWTDDTISKTSCREYVSALQRDQQCTNNITYLMISHTFTHLCGTNFAQPSCIVLPYSTNKKLRKVYTTIPVKDLETLGNSYLAYKSQIFIAFGGLEKSRILKYQLDQNTQRYVATISQPRLDTTQGSTITFISSFTAGEKAFFLFNEKFLDGEVVSYIGQLCLNDQGGGTHEWASFMKTKLVCNPDEIRQRQTLISVYTTKTSVFTVFRQDLASGAYQQVVCQYNITEDILPVFRLDESVDKLLRGIVGVCQFGQGNDTDEVKRRYLEKYKFIKRHPLLEETAQGVVVYREEFREEGDAIALLTARVSLEYSTVILGKKDMSLHKLVIPRKSIGSIELFKQEKWRLQLPVDSQVTSFDQLYLNKGMVYIVADKRRIYTIRDSLLVCREQTSKKCCECSANQYCQWTGKSCVRGTTARVSDPSQVDSREVDSHLACISITDTYDNASSSNGSSLFLVIRNFFEQDGSIRVDKVLISCCLGIVFILTLSVCCLCIKYIRTKNAKSRVEESATKVLEALHTPGLELNQDPIRQITEPLLANTSANITIGGFSLFDTHSHSLKQQSSAGFGYHLPASRQQINVALENLELTLKKDSAKKFNSLPRIAKSQSFTNSDKNKHPYLPQFAGYNNALSMSTSTSFPVFKSDNVALTLPLQKPCDTSAQYQTPPESPLSNDFDTFGKDGLKGLSPILSQSVTNTDAGWSKLEELLPENCHSDQEEEDKKVQQNNHDTLNNSGYEKPIILADKLNFSSKTDKLTTQKIKSIDDNKSALKTIPITNIITQNGVTAKKVKLKKRSKTSSLTPLETASNCRNSREKNQISPKRTPQPRMGSKTRSFSKPVKMENYLGSGVREDNVVTILPKPAVPKKSKQVIKRRESMKSQASSTESKGATSTNG